MKDYATCLKTLGEETRLRIVQLLAWAGRDLCVCELVDALREPQYNISKHLKELKHAGLVRERRDGRWVYYGIEDQSGAFTRHLLEAVKAATGKAAKQDRQRLKARFALRIRGKCLLGIQTPAFKPKGNHEPRA